MLSRANTTTQRRMQQQQTISITLNNVPNIKPDVKQNVDTRNTLNKHPQLKIRFSTSSGLGDNFWNRVRAPDPSPELAWTDAPVTFEIMRGAVNERESSFFAKSVMFMVLDRLAK